MSNREGFFLKLFWKITALMGMGLILAASIITFPYLPAISPVHDTGEQKEFIRYVEFNPCYAALDRALAEDIRAHEEGMERNWIDTLSFWGQNMAGTFPGIARRIWMNILKSWTRAVV